MHDSTRTRSLVAASLLALALASSQGCRRDSTLDDVAPAPGDPYANAKTPPEQMPSEARPKSADQPNLGAPPPRADAPPPQDTARPRSGPPPRQPTAAEPQKPAPEPAPAPPAASTVPKAPPPAAKKKEPDVAANKAMVSDFGLCRAKCDSDPDLDPENTPTCKLACINDTAAKDTYAMGCKRDCMRDASRCYDPCESSGSASCRQGCERTLLSCMNDCDVVEPG